LRGKEFLILKISEYCLDKATELRYNMDKQNKCSNMGKITTNRQITIMLGKHQAATGERLSLRRLAHIADVPKDLIYRMDAGEARYVDLEALARVCDALGCRADEILVWESDEARGGDDARDGDDGAK
jgi:DNA-binding Xre family transcriptional regulator